MRRGLIALGLVLLLAAQAQAGIERPHTQSLPLAVRAPLPGTSTPTRTATATSTPTQTPTATQVPVTLWPNGDFEQGPTGWAATNDGEITTTLVLPATPHSGSFVARLGGVNANAMTIDRLAMPVPVNTPYLSYWVWIQSTEPNCFADFGAVVFVSDVNPGFSILDRFPVCTDTQVNGWVNRVIDMSAHAGDVGTFEFSTESPNGIANSIVYWDDIGWRATPLSP